MMPLPIAIVGWFTAQGDYTHRAIADFDKAIELVYATAYSNRGMAYH